VHGGQAGYFRWARRWTWLRSREVSFSVAFAEHRAGQRYGIREFLKVSSP
jgi:hypothetical protein